MTTWKDDRSKPEPQNRPVPKMPEGYYSGDRPNPHLREFVEKNMTPYDPEHDDYQVEPFNEAITTTKATAIYNMHTYWSKKPHDAIRPDQDLCTININNIKGSLNIWKSCSQDEEKATKQVLALNQR